MQYAEGKVGRVFLVRFDHGEDFLESLQNFVTDKAVRSGTVQFLGALSEGRLVTGPKKPVVPPEPNFEIIGGGWEIFGFATILQDGAKPSIHLHASVGRGRQSLTGCLREHAQIYLVVEAVITEFIGMNVKRVPDVKTGLNLPGFDVNRSIFSEEKSQELKKVYT